MVVCVSEHVVRFELAPLHFLQVEAPYDCHVGDMVEVLCSSKGGSCGRDIQAVVAMMDPEKEQTSAPDRDSNAKEVTRENSTDRQQ